MSFHLGGFEASFIKSASGIGPRKVIPVAGQQLGVPWPLLSSLLLGSHLFVSRGLVQAQTVCNQTSLHSLPACGPEVLTCEWEAWTGTHSGLSVRLHHAVAGAMPAHRAYSCRGVTVTVS